MSTYKEYGECEFDGKKYKILQWDDNSFDGSYEFVRIDD